LPIEGTTAGAAAAARSPSQFTIGNCLLLLVCCLLFFRGLGDRDLWSSHEARAAQDAQSLLDDGFGRMPRLFDGRVELQKPPLYYWLVALTARALGGPVDAWAVRLPSALAGLAGVLGLYACGRRRGRPVAGLVAAAVLATSLHYAWLARVGRIDMPLTLTTAVALGVFYRIWARGRPRADLAAAYVALAAGLLLKGPIGAALPLAVAGAWLLLHREVPAPWRGRAWWTLLHRYGAWWGVPLVLLLAGPVYFWANAQTGGQFFRIFLWHHNVERGFGGSEVLRSHPWWFYAPHLLGDFLPWSLLLPAAAWLFFRRGLWREDAEACFGLVWLLTVGLLLSAMRFKRADYLLPAFPGAALFLGCVGERWARGLARPGRAAGAFAAAVGACVAGWCLYLAYDVRVNEPARESVRFAAEVRRRAPAPRPVLFFRTEAHDLAFRVGRPLAVFVEWENLAAWAARPEPVYVVMPAKVAAEWPRALPSGRLEEVLRGTDLGGDPSPEHDKPLVLLRTVPAP
jgi:4-amino-4-deoxy-L-arabinose transferase-like glycosyltransferase